MTDTEMPEANYTIAGVSAPLLRTRAEADAYVLGYNKGQKDRTPSPARADDMRVVRQALDRAIERLNPNQSPAAVRMCNEALAIINRIEGKQL